MSAYGSWSKYKATSPEEIKIFEEAVSNFEGSEFDTPLIVASQLVNGMNYKFICNASMVTRPPVNYTAEVIIYVPIKGEPKVANVRNIDL